MTDPQTTGRGRDGGEAETMESVLREFYPDALSSDRNHVATIERAMAREIADLRNAAARSAARKDTARLDWMAKQSWLSIDNYESGQCHIDVIGAEGADGSSFRAAIDAAIASQHPRDGDE